MENRFGGNPDLLGRSAEIESGKESQEHKESLQQQVDLAFELEARLKYGEGADWDLSAEGWRACETLIEPDLEMKLGMRYSLKKEDEFSLATGPQAGGWRDDPMNELAVNWEAKIDLPTGKIVVEYGVNQRSADDAARLRRQFYEPLLEDQRIEHVASPEAIERVYVRLEAAHAELVKVAEESNAGFDEFRGWAQGHQKTRFGREEWDKHSMLTERAHLPEGRQWDAYVEDRGDTVSVVIGVYKDDYVDDVFEFARMAAPRKRFPRRLTDE